MSRVVVAGGAGFLGSHLCDRLLQRGDTVVCLDDFSTGSKGNVAHLLGHERFTLIVTNVSESVELGDSAPVDAVCDLRVARLAVGVPRPAPRHADGRQRGHPSTARAGPGARRTLPHGEHQ